MFQGVPTLAVGATCELCGTPTVTVKLLFVVHFVVFRQEQLPIT